MYSSIVMWDVHAFYYLFAPFVMIAPRYLYKTSGKYSPIIKATSQVLNEQLAQAFAKRLP